MQREPVLKAPAPSIESAYGWWVAAVTVLISSISFGAVTSSSILLVPMSNSFGTGMSSLSLVHTSAMMGAAAGSLILGRLLDRHGFFAIAIAGACATASGLAIAAFTENLVILYLAFGLLIGGIGQGAFFSPLTANLARWFDRNRSIAVALGTSGQAIGGLVMAPALRWGAEQIGWRNVLWSYALLGGLALLAGALVFRRQPPQIVLSAASKAVIHRGMSLSGFLLLGACFSFSNASTYVAVGHLTAYGEEHGYSILSAAGLLSTLLGVVMVSRVAFGFLAARSGTWTALLLVSALHVIGAVWLALSQDYTQAALGAALIGLGFGGYVPGYALLVLQSFPAIEAGKRTSQIYVFSFLSAGSGSLLGGWLRDLTGNYSMSFAAAAVGAATGFLLLLLARRVLVGTVSPGLQAPPVQR